MNTIRDILALPLLFLWAVFRLISIVFAMLAILIGGAGTVEYLHDHIKKMKDRARL